MRGELKGKEWSEGRRKGGRGKERGVRERNGMKEGEGISDNFMSRSLIFMSE
jgi:hypothetical protein